MASLTLTSCLSHTQETDGLSDSHFLSLTHRKLMASTHVNHNIYITEVQTGKCLHSLVGHRRTPWCVTFHPTIPGLVASGCLDGEVRIWDLHVS